MPLKFIDIPKPMGDFILAQKDIEPTLTVNGAWYHYKDVVTMLHRFKESQPQQSFSREEVLNFMADYSGFTKKERRLAKEWLDNELNTH